MNTIHNCLDSDIQNGHFYIRKKDLEDNFGYWKYFAEDVITHSADIQIIRNYNVDKDDATIRVEFEDEIIVPITFRYDEDTTAHQYNRPKKDLVALIGKYELSDTSTMNLVDNLVKLINQITE